MGYNPFRWYTSGKYRKRPLKKSAPLLLRIQNGDLESSPFFREAEDNEKLYDKMYNEYNKFWNNERLIKARLIGLSKTEISILASIVQKESIMKDERPKIAGVYLNRLKKRMRLQADPTVIFAIKNNSGDFNRKIKRVLYKDLRIKSPYNTYRNKGLPPGPICMPDLDAIDAILNSENHKYLYFVADPENRGYHLFGRNLREHNNNRKKYIRWINKKKIYR